MANSTKTEAAAVPKPPDTIVWRFNDDPMPRTTLTGSCHCGAVKFRVEHEPLARYPGFHIPVKDCNCSICARNGYLLIYPERKDIEWLSGWDGLKTYRFATGKKAHRFCGDCGSSICLDPEGSWEWAGDVVGINVRMLDDFDIETLNLHKKDGKSFVPQ